MVVLPTDKTGNFAAMRRESYEAAGQSHVKEDKEVDWSYLKNAQRELNGHAAMWIKVFRIGKNWNHVARVRETMIGDSLAIRTKEHRRANSPQTGYYPAHRRATSF